ncbi:hypothetical protein [Enterobacter kobei]|uniref:hypothetical protein n=1 Tax=Enterobacter kobei TaxID=208224 RepID=UPI003CF1E893
MKKSNNEHVSGKSTLANEVIDCGKLASAIPQQNSYSIDDFILNVERINHFGELADDGSDANRDQTAGVYWRQFNCYIQFRNNGSVRKISTWSIPAHKNKGSDQNVPYLDYMRNGYRTRAYLWDPGTSTAIVELWPGYHQEITAVNKVNALCITLITTFNFDGSEMCISKPDGSYGIVGIIYDQNGSAYNFTPNYNLYNSLPGFNEIKSLRDLGTIVNIGSVNVNTVNMPKRDAILQNVMHAGFLGCVYQDSNGNREQLVAYSRSAQSVFLPDGTTLPPLQGVKLRVSQSYDIIRRGWYKTSSSWYYAIWDRIGNSHDDGPDWIFCPDWNSNAIMLRGHGTYYLCADYQGGKGDVMVWLYNTSTLTRADIRWKWVSP